MGRKNSNRWAISALVAAGVGYLLGILTAPKSGKETRKDIKQTANRAVTESEKHLKQLHSDLGKLIDKSRQQTEGLGLKAKAELHLALKKAQVAKNKARTILSAVHEGEAADKELDKAIKEAKEALQHLKNYLSGNDKTQ